MIAEIISKLKRENLRKYLPRNGEYQTRSCSMNLFQNIRETVTPYVSCGWETLHLTLKKNVNCMCLKKQCPRKYLELRRMKSKLKI
jgi:hypothetical protein